MSIQSEINRISGAKSDIATAIANKGVTVPSGTKLDGMAGLISNIEQGGSAPNLQSKSVTYTSNGTKTVTPDSGYDGLSSVDVTVDVSDGGGTNPISVILNNVSGAEILLRTSKGSYRLGLSDNVTIHGLSNNSMIDIQDVNLIDLSYYMGQKGYDIVNPSDMPDEMRLKIEEFLGYLAEYFACDMPANVDLFYNVGENKFIFIAN